MRKTIEKGPIPRVAFLYPLVLCVVMFAISCLHYQNYLKEKKAQERQTAPVAAPATAGVGALKTEGNHVVTLSISAPKSAMDKVRDEKVEMTLSEEWIVNPLLPPKEEIGIVGRVGGNGTSVTFPLPDTMNSERGYNAYYGHD